MRTTEKQNDGPPPLPTPEINPVIPTPEKEKDVPPEVRDGALEKIRREQEGEKKKQDKDNPTVH